MHSCHNPFHCFVPPYVVDKLAETLPKSEDPELRKLAGNILENARAGAAARANRVALAAAPMMSAVPSPEGKLYRLVYDMQHSPLASRLPGRLLRTEGEAPSTDEAVNEAYDFSGDTYTFYREVLGRNSLDNRGMTLISSVHFHQNYNNAFWNGEQMTYGDGDGRLFQRFTKALDVVAHELTHGVVQHTCNLEYADEPGALNESFADVMSACIKQWKKQQDVTQADWILGDAIMVPTLGVSGLRTFKGEKAYVNHPLMGTDPQPKHYRDKYNGTEDEGGVHINSGIPNHAFYLACMKLGGNSWERIGKIWYSTMKNLTSFSNFQEAARMTHQVALADYGVDSPEVIAVREAWDTVGIAI